MVYNCRMTTNTFNGAIILLNQTPDPTTVDNIAHDVIEDQFRGIPCEHYITDTLPESTPVDIYDQYTATIRDLPAGAVYLVVVPAE